MLTLVLLDLSKAFDRINHSILLRKFESSGASPCALCWFNSYLSGRTQPICIETSTSSPLPQEHGVPQGATLSPLLFSIYLNDLPTVVLSCPIESYRDDSKRFMSLPRSVLHNSIKALEEDMQQIAYWCCSNRLLIKP